ncbi:MAG: methionyl-tRNA formyltransferase [Longimicrobiales bacterium]|nr:methionyl-tRNA formyltransferase [Longimicrobiales bacterium]
MRVLFWGTPHFAVPTLRALIGEGHDVVGVVTQPDRPRGRGRVPTPSPVREVAEAEGVPVLTPERPRGEAFLTEIGALEPDASVVVAYGHILLPEVLELPPLGSWNLHASLLPAWRGAAPIHRAIAAGESETGVTVMRMEEGLDSGPILLSDSVPIAATDTSSGLALRLAEVGARAMIEALCLLEFDEPRLVEQDHARATYAPKLSREGARIEWSRTGREVRDHVRAMDAVPGAWTTWRGEPIKLFAPTPGIDAVAGTGGGRDAPTPSSASPPPPASAPPGTVVDADPDRDDGVAVATGEGAVRFGEVQPPGRRRMPVAAWLRGRSLERGERFGE